MAYTTLSDIWNEYDVVERKHFDAHDISAAISELPKDSSEAQLCRYEALAFGFTPHKGTNEWNTYYASQWTFTKKDTGEEIHVPDIKDIDSDCIAYWETRAGLVKNPLLKMRYTGLVLDFKKKITGVEPSFNAIKKANVDAIIAVVNGDYPKYDIVELDYANRGLDLSVRFRNQDLQTQIVDAFFQAHKRFSNDDAKPGIWGKIFQSLIRHREAFSIYEPDIIKENLDRLDRIEALALAEGERTDKYAHLLEQQVDILCEYYHSIGDDIKIENLLDRLLVAMKKSISVRGGMWGQMMLERIQRKYRNYNFDRKANRLFVDIKDLGGMTLKEMKPVEYSVPVDGKIIESFLSEALAGNLNDALIRYLIEYIPIRQEEIRRLKENAEKYPLMDMVATVTIDSSGNTMSRIGIGEDAEEQKLHHSMYENIRFSTPLMHLHMGKLRQEKQLNLETLMELFDGSPIMNDGNREYFKKGFEAYLAGDDMVCCHLLIPQFEAAVRRLISLQGANILRAQADPNDGNEYLSLDSLLEIEEAKECFKEDLITYFKVVFTSKTGWNLRNLVSHGLLPSESFNYMMSDRVVHCVLILSQFRVTEEK